MKALIDSDIFQYEYGSCTDDEYKPLSWPLVQARVQGRINSIMMATGATSYQLYLTSDDKSNFRYKTATIRPYKGHRPTEKPYWYQGIRNFLVDHRGAQEISEHEADDAISIDQRKDLKSIVRGLDGSEWNKLTFATGYGEDYNYCNTVICSRDKDLDMIPGWHYSWAAGGQKEKSLWFQTEIGGLRCFYKQLLTGDPVDNIPGLYGVGKSSTLVKHIDTCETEVEMYDYCFEQYKKRFGSYAHQFMLENGRLLWLLTYPGEKWNGPVD